MSASEKRAKYSAAAWAGRCGLYEAVDEIVESVLDASDLEILEALGEERGSRELGDELLREMLVDVLGRYWARQQQAAILTGDGEGGS